MGGDRSFDFRGIRLDLGTRSDDEVRIGEFFDEIRYIVDQLLE